MTGAYKWPLELVSRQPFRFFRPALIFLSYPAKVARVIGVAPTLSFARQANVHAVGLHTQSGPPRCRAVLCRLRGDCITAMLAGQKSSSLNLRQLLGLIRTVLYSMSYRRGKLVDPEVVATSP